MATVYKNNNYTGKKFKFYRETQTPDTNWELVIDNNAWGKSVNSLQLDPGFLFCGYENDNYAGSFKCWDKNIPNMSKEGWSNRIASFRLKRDCSFDGFQWVNGCNYEVVNKNSYVNDCKINSKCYLNKINACKTADLSVNKLCKKTTSFFSFSAVSVLPAFSYIGIDSFLFLICFFIIFR